MWGSKNAGHMKLGADRDHRLTLSNSIRASFWAESTINLKKSTIKLRIADKHKKIADKIRYGQSKRNSETNGCSGQSITIEETPYFVLFPVPLMLILVLTLRVRYSYSLKKKSVADNIIRQGDTN